MYLLSQKIKDNAINEICVGVSRQRIGFLKALVIFFGLIVTMRLLEVAIPGGLYGLEFKEKSTNIADKRGKIIDRDGNILATTISTYSLFADTTKIRDPKTSTKKLIKILDDLDKEKTERLLSSGRKFVWIKRKISPNIASKINLLGVPGLDFRIEPLRYYPLGSLTSHVVGHVNIDQLGQSGIEGYFNSQLSSGNDVTTSFDMRVQHVVREELAKGANLYKAKKAVGIVLDINSGEVISMVSLPDFNPNKKIDPDAQSYVNNATLSSFEMGSTFKAFTIAAALDSKTANFGSIYNVSSPLRLGKKLIRDTYKYKNNLSLSEVFSRSSNIGSSLIALDLGFESQKKYLKRFGLLDDPELEIYEISSPLAPKKWGELESVTISYGYGIAVTPIQIITSVSALVNGGVLNTPTVIKIDNRNDRSPVKKQRVILQDTSEAMKILFRLVVEEGTGSNAKVPGYQVGGKTGTANKLDPHTGKYDHNKRVSSFIAAFPIMNPLYSILVLYDEPKPVDGDPKHATGGWTAAPIVANIIGRISPILGVSTHHSNTTGDLASYARDGAKFVAY